ncbi:MAG: bifunctional (p)ppGpp synthetase/guanosine-3',5'-bis(diphosphate) 3'-pyrophosphohydrolase [Actinomycetia bacterium]|nr:bifunctional (p)ppGpp synthetase/guanosine-3',5'-bis(diphosphate) 3'-pyrophosphohydrolase [Actinomycetes bacterium]
MVIKTETGILLKTLKKFYPEINDELIIKAFKFAKKSHFEQRRHSGEDFISHPLKVAEICAELGLDETVLIAALLHDVVEDTPVTLKEIKKEFGEEISLLVDGVTKLEKIKYRGEKGQAENYRKMILAMSKDIRVILIKLADRLHNLRTISHLEPEKQRKKAKETIEVYAPLAHRLGISSIKSEMEDLSFNILKEKKYNLIKKLVAETKKEREVFLNEIITVLKKELNKVGIDGEISGRAKHFYSIYEKMKQKGKEFNEIYDLSAVRVIVESVKDCYGALGVIHALWKPIPGRFKDYIAMAKFNLYQSLHTSVIGPHGKPIEIQIRTKEMHRISDFGIAAHWRYKEGTKGENKFEEKLSWLRQIIELESDIKNPNDFLKALKVDIFEDEVFVFTPKGDVVSLPVGSTPLDFAYTIHTEVGHNCVGAKVNNKIVSLDYNLQSGDFIEVLTSKSSPGPSRDWLGITRTSRAKSKIKQWFSKEARDYSISDGREALLKALKKQGLASKVALDSEIIKKIAGRFNFGAAEILFAAIGSGNLSSKQVVTKVIQEMSKGESGIEEVKIKRPVKVRTVAPAGVRVKRVDDVLVRLSRCCNPVPGDKIIGYITQGRGISIHRKDCSNMRNIEEKKDRLVDVYWDSKITGLYKIEIQVDAVDRTKLLRDVSTTLSDAGVNILSAEVRTSKDSLAHLRFVFELGNLSILSDIIKNIKEVNSVFDAYRV